MSSLGVEAYAQQLWGQCGGPCYSWHLMVTCAMALELVSSVVFYSPFEFLMNVISAPLALYSAGALTLWCYFQLPLRLPLNVK